MGLFSGQDKKLREARIALNEQHDDERKALRRGDEDATERNLKLQDAVREAAEGSSKLARGLWG